MATAKHTKETLLTRVASTALPALSRARELVLACDRRVMLACGALLLVVWFLYPPVRSLYVANRQQEVLAMELETLEDRNEELMEDIEGLQTREGIEQEARELGYVSPGEVAVEVEGLEEPEEQSVDGDVVPDDSTWPWYVRVADFLFGFDPRAA